MIQQELPYVDPVAVAERLKEQPGFAFLDSASDDLTMGRYAFIGHQPFGSFVIRNGRAYWNDAPLDGAPLDHLREAINRYTLPAEPDAPPFRGGCIGHISYDLGRTLETLDTPAPAAPGCSDLRFGFYDVVCVFDRQDQRFWVYSSGFPETGAKAGARATARLKATLALLDTPETPSADNPSVSEWTSNFTPAAYQTAVERVRDYIRAGDIYQANLSQRFEAPLPDGFDPWALYRDLRQQNPAPFAAYLQDGPVVFASSSPERFLSLRNGAVEARPIKGTSPRSDDPEQDQALADALSKSDKDRAENIMIVDLLRNDLSRVCEPGSVEVPVLCGLETYASVHHLTSVIRGQMRAGLGAVDLIEASFPGGSITGVPKIRAMNIITELEQAARGVYCGSIGYIGFDGAMDLSIVIRTAVIGAGRAVVQAGGGITLLSDPKSEYDETLTKAERVFAAFAARR